MSDTNFKKLIQKRILIWTIFSILGAASIPIMIVALVNLNWFVAIPTMAIVSFDVIALPIGWTFLGIMFKHKRIVKAIVEEQIYHLKDLSVMFNMRSKDMKDVVTLLMRKGYIKGFKFNEINTELINTLHQKTHKGLCQYCGAPIPLKAYECAYCHGLVKTK